MIYNDTLVTELRKYFLDNKLTLAVAESVTGGHLQAACSAASEAGLFYHGGITAYNLGQKARHLNVEPIHAECYDCVSEKVAREMALGVAKMFLSDVAVSTTGYATPIPEKGVDEIYAYIAVARNNEILLCKRIESDKKQGVDVQIDFSNQALGLILEALKNG